MWMGVANLAPHFSVLIVSFKPRHILEPLFSGSGWCFLASGGTPKKLLNVCCFLDIQLVTSNTCTVKWDSQVRKVSLRIPNFCHACVPACVVICTPVYNTQPNNYSLNNYYQIIISIQPNIHGLGHWEEAGVPGENTHMRS